MQDNENRRKEQRPRLTCTVLGKQLRRTRWTRLGEVTDRRDDGSTRSSLFFLFLQNAVLTVTE